MPTFAADEIVTAAKMNLIAKGVLGYAETTTGQAGIGTSLTDLTSMAVTVDVSSATRRIQIIGQVTVRQLTAAGSPTVQVFEGGTYLGTVGRTTLPTSGFSTLHGGVIITPTGGSHTYKLRGVTTNNTMDVIADGTSFGPSSILVVDLGAV